MKFLRFGPTGSEKPGVMMDDGGIRDLSSLVDDINPASIASGALAKIKPGDLTSLPVVDGTPRIGSCLATTGNFIAIGLNYVQHAKETNSPIPEEPILFNKAPSCINGPDDEVILPKNHKKVDWEVELALVIGKRTQHVSEDDALDHVFGYFVCNDVSERHFQIERGGQWMKGKCCPTFGPIGPWLVTSDEVGDPQNLGLWFELNGKRLQDSNTDDMIFTVKKCISYLSDFMILEPGDIITTGTPPGVGLGMKPPLFLKEGDVMRVGVEGLGVQEQKVVAFRPS